MTEYQLSIGAPKGDDDADVYESFDTFNVTRGASSMDTWSATLPMRDDFEESLLDDIWIYHNDEIILRGELESFSTDYQQGTTDLNGRGQLVEMDRVTTSVHYQDTTVYDTITEFWNDTTWDALVLPPNRDVQDTLQVSEYDHAEIWSFEASRDGYIYQSEASLSPNRLEINESNVVIDETEYTDARNSLFESSGTDEWWILVETDTAVKQFDLGIHQQERFSDDGIYEESWDSVDHNTPQHFHLFHVEFDEEWDRFRPKLDVGDETFDIVRTEVFLPDRSRFSVLDEVDIEGTQFEVLQELHDIGSYEFVIDDYETMDVRSFPTGTLRGEPDWRITSATRSKDLTEYANQVTVTGKVLDDGTTNTATAEDEVEIDEMAERGIGDNGVIETFEKNPDVSTQEEVDSRADRLLTESINERDESGSIEIVPQEVAPGYTYNVSVWGDAFPYGSQIGSNSLYFRGNDSPGDTPDQLEFDWNNVLGGTDGNLYTWEFLIHPEELSELDDDEYYRLFEFDYDDIGRAYIDIYGDGSVEWDDTGNTFDPSRTDPDTVREDQSQRLTIQWGEDDYHQRRVFVDGQLEFEDTEWPPTFNMENGTYYIGASSNGDNPYKGGVDDVRLWAEDEYKSQDWIRTYKDDDLIATDESLDGCPVYLRCDDHINPDEVINDGASINFNSSLNGPQYQTQFGQIEEVQYSLGDGDTLSLNFDISGRIDTELISTQRSARTNRRSL